MPVEHVHPLVRTQKQLDRVLNEIEEMPGIVLYTLLQENLAARLESANKYYGTAVLLASTTVDELKSRAVLRRKVQTWC